VSHSHRTGTALTAADDDFHQPDDNPWYLETFWFSYNVPERNLEGYIYTKFYPNQRIYGGGALAWDHTAYLPWEILYYDLQWHLPWPEVETLKDCALPNGTSLKCLEPLQKYHVKYQSEEHDVDIIWDAVLPASRSRAATSRSCLPVTSIIRAARRAPFGSATRSSRSTASPSAIGRGDRVSRTARCAWAMRMR
jgi:hypothetical protein